MTILIKHPSIVFDCMLIKFADGELTIEDKYKRTMDEIEALKDHLCGCYFITFIHFFQGTQHNYQIHLTFVYWLNNYKTLTVKHSSNIIK